MFPIRLMYIEAINRRQHQHLDDAPTSSPTRASSTRCGTLRDAGGRPAPGALKSNHIVADWLSRGYFSQLLDGRRPDLPLQGRDGAREDVDRGRVRGRRSVRRTSTGSA
jgi:hypothetical protein